MSDSSRLHLRLKSQPILQLVRPALQALLALQRLATSGPASDISSQVRFINAMPFAVPVSFSTYFVQSQIKLHAL